MTKRSFSLLTLALLFISASTKVLAVPTDEMIHQLNAQVLRVQVALANGSYGLGSGVVVAKDQVVTNCHVVANAVSVSVVSNGSSFPASGVIPDWKHDVCVLKVEGLDAPSATIGSSKNLKYEQPVFTIGYPSFLPIPTSTYGVVKGLFPMDDSVVIRATSSFRMGASGGGVFDDDGKLVGIITLKSPGRNAYYYNMPVEWVQALLDKPVQPIVTKSELPFWAKSLDEWPYFMKVVQPYLTEDWQALKEIANKWVQAEPNATEAWFYLAAAEYATKDTSKAEEHLHKVVAMNNQHSQAIYYLGLIAEANGQHGEALTQMALLSHLDEYAASELKTAIGMAQ
ncbi:MAG: trypsin-like peptidase domain-containing protein [Methylophilus sp.]|nr:trypsin-like peptidase domain-containing protein [Methylophilus sp.]